MVKADEKAQREKTKRTKLCWEETEDHTGCDIVSLLEGYLRTLRSTMV